MNADDDFKATRYFFTRHGESQANVDRIFAGAVESPLTENGRIAAQAEAERLAIEKVRYDLIISSPLSRAFDTACIIADALGYPRDNIVIEELLRERSFGNLVGKPWSSIADESSEAVTNAGGESAEELSRRVRTSLEKVGVHARGKERVLIVGHGTWYQMAMTLIEGKDSAAFLEAEGLPNNKVVPFPVEGDL